MRLCEAEGGEGLCGSIPSDAPASTDASLLAVSERWCWDVKPGCVPAKLSCPPHSQLNL